MFEFKLVSKIVRQDGKGSGWVNFNFLLRRLSLDHCGKKAVITSRNVDHFLVVQTWCLSSAEIERSKKRNLEMLTRVEKPLFKRTSPSIFLKSVT